MFCLPLKSIFSKTKPLPFLILVVVLVNDLITCSKEVRTVKAASEQDYVVSLSDNLDNFPIYGATQGTGAVECYTGNNTSIERVIEQWSNTKSLCSDTDNSPSSQECKGADLARETDSSKFCFWKDQKKILTSVDTLAMDPIYKGCYLHRDKIHLNNPGGYSVYLMWQPNLNTFLTNPPYTLANLDKLFLSTSYATNFYANPEICKKRDPVVGTDPAVMAYMNAVFVDVNPATNMGRNVVFYQTVLYDNRGKWQKPGAIYKSCKFQNTSGIRWIAITENIATYGLPIGLPGDDIRYYEWDILPKVKKYVQECLKNPKVDFSTYKISGVFIGNELVNNTQMANTFIDPKVRMVPKNKSVIGNHELALNNNCVVKGWTCDPDNYKLPLTVEFYEGTRLVGQTLADNKGELTVKNRCNGVDTHGFLKSLSLPTGTHKITAKALEINGFNNQTGNKTVLIGSKQAGAKDTVTITCVAPSPTPIGTPTSTPTATPISTPTPTVIPTSTPTSEPETPTPMPVPSPSPIPTPLTYRLSAVYIEI
jgi:hypothetical protein